MELENMLSEVNLVQKNKGHMFLLICGGQIQWKYKHYHMFLKVELLEETMGGRTEQRNVRGE
jgi:hypothetical protein